MAHEDGPKKAKKKKYLLLKVVLVFIFLVIVIGIIVKIVNNKKTKEEDNLTGDVPDTGQVVTKPPTVVKVPSGLVYLPDQYTPCEIPIMGTTQDLYTDGEPIYALPPGWSEESAIYYSGKGRLVVTGGNIRSGVWKFWSANDPERGVVLIRVLVKN